MAWGFDSLSRHSILTIIIENMLLDIVIIIITTYTTWYASKILAKGTEGIGGKYNISSSVKGATLDAVGSSFPEFCTVIFCLIAGSFEAGIGAITGSALNAATTSSVALELSVPSYARTAKEKGVVLY